MCRKTLKTADVPCEVAVLPIEAESPCEVVQIAQVRRVGHVFIETTDGHLYFREDGADFNPKSWHYIQPATDEHRRAIRRRSRVATNCD